MGKETISYIMITSEIFSYELLSLINFARDKSDRVFCGILTDKVLESQHYFPILEFSKRKAIAESIKFIDEVLVQDSRGPLENLKKIHSLYPDAKIILIHGSNSDNVLGSEYIKKIGGEVLRFKDFKGFSISDNAKLFKKKNLPNKKRVHNFIHGWGGTTSIQSLECHVLRYIEFPNQVCNSITGKIFCDIKNGHHTVYFEKEDVERWEKEGEIFFEKDKREEILEKNINQIERYYLFYEKEKKRDFSALNNHELSSVYKNLMRLVMENGSYFPYSRENATVPLRNRILELLSKFDNKEEMVQILLTPTEKDIFQKELEHRIEVIKSGDMSNENIEKYILSHPWRFINSYSMLNIKDFVKQEILKSNIEELEDELEKREINNINISKMQKKYFKDIDKEAEELALFLQKIAIVRLENKKIWAGYETLFFPLFKEISSRLGLNFKNYLFFYRIEEIINALELGKKLPKEEIEKRGHCFNIEISKEKTELSYSPRYVDEVGFSAPKDNSLSGEAGNLGKVIGRALVVTEDGIDSLMELKKEIGVNDIYVTTMTHPAMISILSNVRGIVTDEGGVTSHAAIISREFDIPCLVGTRNATRFFKTGDIIELDSHNKTARKLSNKEREAYFSCGINYKPITEAEKGIVFKKRKVPEIPYFITGKDLEHLNSIGGKGYNLVGISDIHHVPSAFFLTRKLFDEIINSFLSKNHIEEIDLSKNLSKTLSDIRNYIQKYSFNEEFARELEDMISRYDYEYFAIRSSASCEDSDKLSFAGQFDTFLGIKKENLVFYIKKCLASAFSENVIAYLKKSDLNYGDFYMSVVLQAFLQSDKAGVFFSRNPSGSQEGFCIEANFGIGESVVSGEVSPDRYFVSKNGLTKQISENKKIYSYNHGMKELVGIKSTPVLEDEEILQLVNLCHLLLDFYGKDIEFEWCFYKNELYLLQARPITVR